jgi:two-component system, sensor histidine kinase and response regulator
MTDSNRSVAPRVLVVTDDEHARGLLVAVLRADGHTVDAATDRGAALALLARYVYAVVVSDLRLPGLTGPELGRVLVEQHPAVMPALVFVSRPAFAPDFARFLMDSAAQILGWPAKPADISRVVARALAPVTAADRGAVASAAG